MSGLSNPTNFISGISSYLTVSPSVSLFTVPGGGSSRALSLDIPNSFLLDIIKGQGNYNPACVLLLYFNISGALTAPSSSQFTLDFRVQGDHGEGPTTFSSVVMTSDATSIYPASVVAMCNVLEIVASSNTYLEIVITNNSTGTVTPPSWIMSSISSFIPVTYLPYGFQTT